MFFFVVLVCSNTIYNYLFQTLESIAGDCVVLNAGVKANDAHFGLATIPENTKCFCV